MTVAAVVVVVARAGKERGAQGELSRCSGLDKAQVQRGMPFHSLRRGKGME